MKLAIHHNRLKELFLNPSNDVIRSAVLASKISVTSTILSRYHENLGSNTSYMAWFTAMQSSRRFSTCPNNAIPTRIRAIEAKSETYSIAAYFSGSNLFAENADFSADAIQALSSAGIKTIDAASLHNKIGSGENPFYEIKLKTNGAIDFSVLDDFLLSEDKIVVYDKYINNTSIELLEYFAKNIHQNGSLTVFHSSALGNNLLSSSQIESRIKASAPSIHVRCSVCPASFTKENHDRYVFLGQRCQINFSAGLDSFGLIDPLSGNRKNRKSTLSFYDTQDCASFTITGANGVTEVVKHHD